MLSGMESLATSHSTCQTLQQHRVSGMSNRIEMTVITLYHQYCVHHLEASVAAMHADHAAVGFTIKQIQTLFFQTNRVVLGCEI